MMPFFYLVIYIETQLFYEIMSKIRAYFDGYAF